MSFKLIKYLNKGKLDTFFILKVFFLIYLIVGSHDMWEHMTYKNRNERSLIYNLAIMIMV